MPINLIEWNAEPGQKDHAGRPASTARPDFTLLINPEQEDTAGGYRTKVQTFPTVTDLVARSPGRAQCPDDRRVDRSDNRGAALVGCRHRADRHGRDRFMFVRMRRPPNQPRGQLIGVVVVFAGMLTAFALGVYHLTR